MMFRTTKMLVLQGESRSKLMSSVERGMLGRIYTEKNRISLFRVLMCDVVFLTYDVEIWRMRCIHIK